jgi:hypothetical protein
VTGSAVRRYSRSLPQAELRASGESRETAACASPERQAAVIPQAGYSAVAWSGCLPS